MSVMMISVASNQKPIKATKAQFHAMFSGHTDIEHSLTLLHGTNQRQYACAWLTNSAPSESVSHLALPFMGGLHESVRCLIWHHLEICP